MKTRTRLGAVLVAGAVAMGLVLGVGTANAQVTPDPKTLQELIAGDDFTLGPLSFDNWTGSIFDQTADPGNIRIAPFIDGNTYGFDVIDLSGDEFYAEGADDAFDLYFGFDVSSSGPGIIAARLEVSEDDLTVPDLRQDGQLAISLSDGNAPGVSLGIAQNLLGTDDSLSDTDFVPLATLLELYGGIGGRTFDTGAIVDVDQYTVSFTVVPVPAAVWLFGSGLMALVGVARRRKMTA